MYCQSQLCVALVLSSHLEHQVLAGVPNDFAPADVGGELQLPKKFPTEGQIAADLIHLSGFNTNCSMHIELC